MKILTIIATIFVPLGLLASLDGIDFNTTLAANMPAWDLPYGYLGALAVMTCVALGLLSCSWRRG